VTDYGSIGVDGGEETELFFKDDVGPLWGELRPGRRVSFAIDWRRGEPFAIQLKLLPSIYAYMGALTSPRWWVRLVAERPHSEVLGLLDKLLARLPNGCGNDAILKALPPELVFAPAARGMRNALPKASLALLAGRRLLRSETSLEERSAFRDAMNELQPR